MALSIVAIASLIAGCPPALAVEASRDVILTLAVKGQQRIAYLHVPANLAGKRYPLIIGYHGGTGNAEGYPAVPNIRERRTSRLHSGMPAGNRALRCG